MSIEQGSNPLDSIDFGGLFESMDSEYKRRGRFGLDNGQSIQDLSATHIARFFVNNLPLKPFQTVVKRGEDIRNLADYVNKEFKNWQVNAHKYTNKKEDEEVIRKITLDDLAVFAKDRFDEFVIQSGGAVPDSEVQKSYQENADYWAWAGQIIDEAIDQNKKKP